MKSKMIRIRNLPNLGPVVRSIRVKPMLFLLVAMLIGTVCLFFNNITAGIGACVILMTFFSIWVLPDRILASVTPQYLILYNQRDRTMCSLIYLDEIVQWQYEWHASVDLLVVKLVDGSSQSIELYSKRMISKYLNEFAPGKEVKTVRRKDEPNVKTN